MMMPAVAALAMLTILQAPLRVDRTQVSAPQQVAVLDMSKLKGEAVRLAWSPDGTQLYVQTSERTAAKPAGPSHHYLFSTANGAKQDVQAEPEWASAYWSGKSGQTPADDPSLKIDLTTEERQERTTASPMGGDLARGGVEADTRSSGGDAGIAGYREPVTVHMMVLKGKTIGEFVNAAIVPGLTFGWGPPGSRAIAYTAVKSGRVVLMDAEGAVREVAGSKDAILPAWSPDGTRLAWLEKDGRKKFVLKIAHVTTL